MDRPAGPGPGLVPGLHGRLLGADADLAVRRAARADAAEHQARRRGPHGALRWTVSIHLLRVRGVAKREDAPHRALRWLAHDLAGWLGAQPAIEEPAEAASAGSARCSGPMLITISMTTFGGTGAMTHSSGTMAIPISIPACSASTTMAP